MGSTARTVGSTTGRIRDGEDGRRLAYEGCQRADEDGQRADEDGHLADEDCQLADEDGHLGYEGCQRDDGERRLDDEPRPHSAGAALACPCGGRRRRLDDVTDQATIVDALAKLGFPTEAPPLARARAPTDDAA